MEKYSLEKAKEEGDKIREQKESGKASSYIRAQSDVEYEAHVEREKIIPHIRHICYIDLNNKNDLEIFNQIKLHPELVKIVIDEFLHILYTTNNVWHGDRSLLRSLRIFYQLPEFSKDEEIKRAIEGFMFKRDNYGTYSIAGWKEIREIFKDFNLSEEFLLEKVSYSIADNLIGIMNFGVKNVSEILTVFPEIKKVEQLREIIKSGIQRIPIFFQKYSNRTAQESNIISAKSAVLNVQGLIDIFGFPLGLLDQWKTNILVGLMLNTNNHLQKVLAIASSLGYSLSDTIKNQPEALEVVLNLLEKYFFEWCKSKNRYLNDFWNTIESFDPSDESCKALDTRISQNEEMSDVEMVKTVIWSTHKQEKFLDKFPLTIQSARGKALNFLKKGKKNEFSDVVFRDIDFFTNLTTVDAFELIAVGEISKVIDHARNFKDFSLDSDTAKKIIECDGSRTLIRHISLFSRLDVNIALLLLKEEGGGDAVFNNQSSFDFLFDKDFAVKLVSTGKMNFLEHYIHYFKDLEYEIEFSKTHHVSISEGLLALHKNPNLQNLPDEEKYRYIAESCPEVWKDEENISRPLHQGAKIFGYKRMFLYLSTHNMTRHDGLHAFTKIIELYNVSGLSPDQFYGNILGQVAKDGATYESGTAHHRLNKIALSLQGRKPEEILKEARGYGSIQGLTKLAEHFSSPDTIFTSWRSLKQFADLVQLLGQRETLEKLKSYRESGNIKLAEFAEKLAFHPGGGVEMGAVMEFVENPQSFLAREESHAPEAHELKKPSNYTEIPNLDLTAEELRDAYVEGSLDRLQAFPPFEMEISVREKTDLRVAVLQALSSRKNEIKPLARDSKKLFSEIGKVLKKTGIILQEYLDGKEMSTETAAVIETLVYDKKFGMPRPKSKETTFRAKVNLKSDPEGVLAGNDTACCMPFGAGKNNVYMFNPITALFTLQLKRGDSYRTIAQSVLTKDKDIKASIPEVMTKLQNQSGNIEDVLPGSILETSTAVIACDNVEVNPNYRDEGQEIESVYRAFFTEYLKRYATELGVETGRVVIGTGYSDSLAHLPSTLNTFAPMAPMGYSDKIGENVYTLNIATSSPMQADIIGISETQVSGKHPELTSVSSDARIQPLTFEDSLPVAYLEGKAYRDNQSLMTYLYNMENGLIAKDINNTAKGRPNMSLKYVDEKGRTRAYLFAYEGRKDIRDSGESEPVIYISDLASDKETRMGGGRLIQAFTEMYNKQYIAKGNFIPIYTEAREQTSYRIIQRQLEKIGESTGIKFELIELPTNRAGEDVMHPVIIRPIS